MPCLQRPFTICALALSTSMLAACGDDGYADSGGYLSGWDGTSGGYDSNGGDGDGDSGDPLPPDENGEETDTGGEAQCNTVDDVVLYLSPDDSNSMSSPVQVRERVLNGHQWLYSVVIRAWEFMNYYSFDQAPAPDGSLALTAAMRTKVAPMEGAEERYDLLLAVSSEEMTDEERPPMNITLVLDTSGSMEGTSIELLRESCYAIASSLHAGDKVSIVEWSSDDTWVLAAHEVDGPDDPLVLGKIAAIDVSGSTDLHGGLTSGYELAQQVWDAEAINRLVLISDGGANTGVTDVELIAQNAVHGGLDGIYLVGVGVGEPAVYDSYSDQLMDTVTDAGKGASVFISDEEEAWKMFHEDFISTMAIAARDVQVELQLPPGFEIVKFSGEEYSSNPKEIEPQHLAPNDSMVLYQQLQTCAPELVDESTEITVIVRWTEVFTFEPRELSQTFTLGELLAAEGGALAKGAAIVAYTDVLVQMAKGDSTLIAAAMQVADAALDEAEAALPGDDDLAEIRSILDALP